MKTEEQQENRQLVEFIPFGTKDKITLSIEIVKRLIAVKTRSGKTASDEDAFKFMLMCQARKLNPFEGDAFLIGYDGQHGASFSLITAHQAFLKRAELHPEFDGMDSGTIVLREGTITDLVGDWHMPNDKILGGWATVFFKNRTHPMKKRLRLERFNKNFGVWRDDPAGMIVKCAEADALRSSFPTMLGGMFISEEIGDTKAEEIARPVFPATEVTTNGLEAEGKPAREEKKVEAKTVEQAKIEEPKAEPEPPKKKEPTLTRKSRARSTVTDKVEQTKAVEQPNHEKLLSLLSVGNYTTDDFVKVALDENWIELKQGTWDKIPESRIAEFLQPENWEMIMTMLDEKKAKTVGAAAERGELL